VDGSFQDVATSRGILRILVASSCGEIWIEAVPALGLGRNWCFLHCEAMIALFALVENAASSSSVAIRTLIYAQMASVIMVDMPVSLCPFLSHWGVESRMLWKGWSGQVYSITVDCLSINSMELHWGSNWTWNWNTERRKQTEVKKMFILRNFRTEYFDALWIAVYDWRIGQGEKRTRRD